MKSLFALAGLLFALCSVPASAQVVSCNGNTFNPAPNTAVYCTAMWTFAGTCNSTDQVLFWTTTGPANAGLGTWKIMPWEAQAITIRHVKLVKIAGGPTIWFAAGNAYTPDIMANIAPNQNESFDPTFPAGTGMPFPSNLTPPSNAYLDLHGSCSGGGGVTMFYRVGYTIP